MALFSSLFFVACVAGSAPKQCHEQRVIDIAPVALSNPSTAPRSCEDYKKQYPIEAEILEDAKKNGYELSLECRDTPSAVAEKDAQIEMWVMSCDENKNCTKDTVAYFAGEDELDNCDSASTWLALPFMAYREKAGQTDHGVNCSPLKDTQ